MFQPTTLKDIQITRANLIKKGKLLYNNYYGVEADAECDIFKTENTILIRKKEFHFYRLFIMSIDKNELGTLLISLSGNEYTINIPSRKPIPEWDSLLSACGFETLDTYSRYMNDHIRTYPTNIDTFATHDEIDAIADLLYSHFSLYTDHLPSRKELQKMVANHQVITDHMDGKVCGTMIYTIIGNKGYQNAWIDNGENGLAMLFKVKSLFLERGVNYCYYWINDNNKPVIKMHSIMGGKPDGLKDYNYLKRI